MAERSVVDEAASGRKYAVITGASSGLGAAFADRLAARGFDLVLVARDEPRLAAVARAAGERHGVRCEVLPADLSHAADRHRVVERIGAGVDFLVNAAGFGVAGSFWTVERALLDAQLAVNVISTQEFTHAALRTMVPGRGGTVVNLSSITGLIPGRGSTYAASKAWIRYFSQGLSAALRGTGTRVMVLSPGFVRTEFHARADIDVTQVGDGWWSEPGAVVDRCLADLARGRDYSLPGLRNKVFISAVSRLPRGLAQRVNRMLGNAGARA
ncbi:SDR family NAD(P)-dependent oxidoreductase [Streptomyces chumphonensis]|uniref:SDR family NAD(P)-dependent oxidoreductase n=1 Tax=Streptomyces chumphonensis TaxID=1214925 RepID=A0A927IDX7_9ACTN|nr:SDR family NAD(P)-dependent oxidoreductase [Streptomyces chumphonensis]MBD3933119.1 SDR family NAD(P)-dependent oxidoreductase [Streptomyces chumphonensis]